MYVGRQIDRQDQIGLDRRLDRIRQDQIDELDRWIRQMGQIDGLDRQIDQIKLNQIRLDQIDRQIYAESYYIFIYSIYCQRTWHFHMTARLASATGSQWQLLLQLWEAMTSGSKPPLDTISAATGWCYRLVPPSFIGWFMGPHLYKYFKI